MCRRWRDALLRYRFCCLTRFRLVLYRPAGGTAASNRITRPVSIVDYVEEFRRMSRSCRVCSVHSEQHLLCFCNLLAVVGARKEMTVGLSIATPYKVITGTALGSGVGG